MSKTTRSTKPKKLSKEESFKRFSNFIAGTLEEAKPDLGPLSYEMWEKVVIEFADQLEEINDSFDRTEFLRIADCDPDQGFTYGWN